MTREDWKELYNIAYDRDSFERFMAAANDNLAASASAEPIYQYKVRDLNGWHDCDAAAYDRITYNQPEYVEVRTLYAAPRPIEAPAQAVMSTEQERERFEAAWSKVYSTGEFLLRHHTLTEQYANHDTQRAWEGWKLARAALDARTTSLFNAREVIAAMILEHEDGGLTDSTIQKARDIVYSPLPIVTPSAENRPAQDDVRDAQRYRWLRLAKYEEAIRALFDFKGTIPLIPWRNAREQLDAAIDAAIASQSAKEPK